MAETRTEKLYNGEVEITFYPDSHRYKLAGEKTYLISATAATGMLDKSQALIPWAVGLMGDYLVDYALHTETLDRDALIEAIGEGKKQHTIRKEKAADTGSLVHGWIELFVASKISGGDTPPLPEDSAVQNGVNAFLDWYLAHDVVFHASERLVYSRQHGYVGLTDFVATVDGLYSVGDWKTSKRVYPEHRVQLSAYWGAIEEEDKRPFDQGLILHFDKENGEFGVHVVTKGDDYRQQYDAFLALLAIKKWDKLQGKN